MGERPLTELHITICNVICNSVMCGTCELLYAPCDVHCTIGTSDYCRGGSVSALCCVCVCADHPSVASPSCGLPERAEQLRHLRVNNVDKLHWNFGEERR